MTIPSKSVATTASSSCEIQELKYKKIILKTLEEKKADIKKAQETTISSPASSSIKLEKLSSVYLESYEPVEQTSSWENRFFTWEKVYKKYYLPLINKTAKDYSEKLINLEYYANSMLYDEQKLKDYPHFFYTTKDDEKILSDLILKLSQRNYEFTKNEKKYISARAIYKLSYDQRNYEALRELLTLIYNRYFEFRKEPTVKRISQNTIEIPLDPGDFDKIAQSRFEEIIYKYWSSAKLKVRIKWVTNSVDSKAYFKVVGAGENGRSYVDYNTRTINLYSGMTEGTLAHEIGHILGFSDLYFDIWQKSKCRFITQVQGSNIMSNSTGGSVLKEHWHTLNQYYPFK
ncbi:MAG: hypothetical protein IPM57_00285 [Oligoflexia bacterium]|nr:hypothetical protein [Oligoflexia bacterium]